MRSTPPGKKLLDYLADKGIGIELGSGDGSYFDDDAGDKIVVDESESLEDMIFTVPHEATHGQRYNDGESGDIDRDAREEYIDKMLDEETDATVAGIEVKQSLEANGETVGTTFPLETEYREAYTEKLEELKSEAKRGKRKSMDQMRKEAKEAGRAAVREGFDNGTVRPGTDRNSNYRDYYGRKYDRDRTQPDIRPPAGPKTSSPEGQADAGSGIGFAGDAPADISQAADRFNRGEIGASVKDRQIEGKTAKQIEDEIAREGGGFVDAGNGKRTTADGQWTYSEGSMMENGQPVKLVFLENKDGGVIRLKPDGVPGANFESMRGPHGAVYVKKDPNGDTGWANEAFKVGGGQALPKTPLHVDPPPGIQKYTEAGAAWRQGNPNAEALPRPEPGQPRIVVFTPEFEAYLKESGWTGRTHVVLGK